MPRKDHPGLIDSIQGIGRSLKRLGGLYVDKVRLKATERITILLSTIAFTAIAIAVGMIFLIFVTIGIGHLLATTIAPHIAYLIVAAFYLLLFLALFVFRKQLFVNPITRLVSRLLLDEPEEVYALTPTRAEAAEMNRSESREDAENEDDETLNGLDAEEGDML